MSDSAQERADSPLLTVAEVALFLKIGDRTVLKMAHEGTIPAVKVGSQWRFMKEQVDDWLRSKTQEAAPLNGLTAMMEKNDPKVPLSRLIDPRYIVLDLTPGSPQKILDQLTQPFVDFSLIRPAEQVRLVEDLLYRESILSTAVPNGIAFPHLRDPLDNPIKGPLIQIGRCDSGTDFGAPDNKPTYLFYLICTENITVHLRVMAKLATAVSEKDFSNRVLNAQSNKMVLAEFLNSPY